MDAEQIPHPSGMDHQELQRLHYKGLLALADLVDNGDTHEIRFKAADQLTWYTLCELNKVHDDAREDAAREKKEWEN